MSALDLVVFDMIGTTVQASDKIPQAFVTAFEGESIHLTIGDVSSIRGKSKREAIRDLLLTDAGDKHANTRSDMVYERFKAILLGHYRVETVTPVEGAEATFAWCRENSVLVALTTGFDRELASILVEKLRWDELIDSLVCNDDVCKGRPAPDLILGAMRRLQLVDTARVASVGDTISDLEAGANAGTGWNIGVLSGAHSRSQLNMVAHTALIDSVADLPALFSQSAG